MRLLTIVLALLASVTMLAPTVTADTDVDCDAFAAYLDEVDLTMATEVHALVTAPGWIENAREATGVLDRSATDTLPRPAGAFAPLLELFAIPGAVLSSIDARDVPHGVSDLHDATTAFWATLPGWIDANIDGDQGDIDADDEALLDHAEDVRLAATALDDACPGIIDARLNKADRVVLIFDLLNNPDADTDAVANATVDDFAGIGTYFLILPELWSMTTPQPVATPAQVTVPTREETPVATPGT